MNLAIVNETLIEAERLRTSDNEEAKTHGMLLLRDLIAVSKRKTGDTRRLSTEDDDDLFDNVPV
jgi:hypothetical protein